MSDHPTPPPTPEREPGGGEPAAYGHTPGPPGSSSWGWGAPHTGPREGPAAVNPTPLAPPGPVPPPPPPTPPPTPEREPGGGEPAAYGHTPGPPGSSSWGWGAPHTGPREGPAAFNPTPFAPPVPVQPRRPRQRRIWPAVFAAGLLGASLASVGTAFLVGESISSPTPSPAASSQPASAPAVAGTPDWANIADEVRPAVVAIQVTGTVRAGDLDGDDGGA